MVGLHTSDALYTSEQTWFVTGGQVFGAQKSIRFLNSARVASDPLVCIFNFPFFGYETMSNCNQKSWINWNSAVLYFKQLFHIWIWTFARFVRPLLATILCIWEIYSPRIHVSHFPLLAKKINLKKARHRTDSEADR